jgi:hypothetical protein
MMEAFIVKSNMPNASVERMPSADVPSCYFLHHF